MTFEINTIINIAREAGEKIMEIYSKDFSVEYKDDKSPLTEADKCAHEWITKELTKLSPTLPILSEENLIPVSYEERKLWDTFWLVDPLDGTKEFIKKNGEFTVNIALIQHSKPVLGVVFAPVKDLLYFANAQGSFKCVSNNPPINLKSILPNKNPNKIKVVGSRSHTSLEFDNYLSQLQTEYSTVELIPMGSSLKICLIADGTADLYPRLGPTQEWDTAAAHAIVHFSGKKLTNFHTGIELTYNKKNLLNEWFVVQ